HLDAQGMDSQPDDGDKPAGEAEAEGEVETEAVASPISEVHKELATWVGRSNKTFKMWPSPGKEPIEFTVLATRELDKMGWFLRETYVIDDFMGMGKMEGEWIIGYDFNSQTMECTGWGNGMPNLFEYK